MAGPPQRQAPRSTRAISIAAPGHETVVGPGTSVAPIALGGMTLTPRSTAGCEVTLTDGLDRFKSVARVTTGDGPTTRIEGFRNSDTLAWLVFRPILGDSARFTGRSGRQARLWSVPELRVPTARLERLEPRRSGASESLSLSGAAQKAPATPASRSAAPVGPPGPTPGPFPGLPWNEGTIRGGSHPIPELQGVQR